MKIVSDHQHTTALFMQEQARSRKTTMEAQGGTARASAETTPADSGERLPGVLRLLQEGHFRGVADVRLRINFHEQLQGLQGDALKAQAPGAVEAFLAKLREKAGDLEQVLDEEQYQQLSALLEGFSGEASRLIGEGSEYTIDSLLKALKSEFGTFLESLQQNIVTGDAPAPVSGDAEPAGSSDVEEDGGEEGTSSPQWFSGLESSLRELFDELLSGLENELGQHSAILPPLSPPQGNGKAYAKFLAILEGLYAAGASDPEPGIDDLV
jgi:hypothetical protein